mmetsp:Transcript_116792/g.227111  ORF Transcript_116792/g.227111 Transcript_116792/m.227111 type:complete len:836 (+) Transcript_116792:8-2515(+)
MDGVGPPSQSECGLEAQQREPTLQREVEKQENITASMDEAELPSQSDCGLEAQQHEATLQREEEKQDNRNAPMDEAVRPSQSECAMEAQQHEPILQREVEKQENTTASADEDVCPNQSDCGMEAQQHELTLPREAEKQDNRKASKDAAARRSQSESGMEVQQHEPIHQREAEKQENTKASREEEAGGPSQLASGMEAEQHESTRQREVDEKEDAAASQQELVGPSEPASVTEEIQKQEETDATASLSYVHLLAVDAGGGHNPQAFRMRQDQTMRRLASSYASFRQLTAEDAACVRMSAAGLESIDPLATVAGIGLADGDTVTFILEQQQKQQQQVAVGAVGCANATGKGRGRRRQPHVEEPAPKRPKQDEFLQEQPKRPLSSYMLWLNKNRDAIAAEVGSGRAPMVSRAAAQHWRALSEAERAPFDQQAAAAKAQYDKALAEFIANGGKLRKRKQGDNEFGNSQQVRRREPMPKKPWGGPFGVFLNENRGEFKEAMPADCRPQDVVRAASEAWRGLSQEEKQGYEDINARNMQDYKRAMEDYKRKYCSDPEIPATPPGLLRTAAVMSGPAKGWKIQCWRTKRGSLKWCIKEPGKTSRGFSNFREFKEAVDRDVYNQVHRSVRPGLLRRMNERVTGFRVEGHVETPAKRRATATTSRAEETPLKAARLSAPPQRQSTKRFNAASVQQAPKRTEADRDWSTLATQACQPPTEVGKGLSWTCSCHAHLMRHPRCISSNGRLQPAVIHLKDHTMVGRAETCDVVLGSTLTPQMLSRNHATIRREGPSFFLLDQGSVNGVLVNGDNVSGPCALNVGDVVTFGVATDAPEFDYVFEPCPCP